LSYYWKLSGERISFGKPLRTYFIQDSLTKFIKIGSSVDPEDRLRVLQIGCPSWLRLVGSVEEKVLSEKDAHYQFHEYVERGEWYRPGPRLEDFIHKHFQVRIPTEFVPGFKTTVDLFSAFAKSLPRRQ